MEDPKMPTVSGLQTRLALHGGQHVASQEDTPVQTTASASRRQMTPTELEALRPVIKRLYIDEGRNFRQVQKYLRTHHDYMPTERQFARLRLKWGMKKTTRAQEREKILRELDENVISEEGTFGSVSLNIEKVKRWRKEREERVSVVKDDSTSSSNNTSDTNSPSSTSSVSSTLSPYQHRILQNTTSPEIVRQPMPRTIRVAEGLIFHIDVYVSGMYEGGAWPITTSHSIEPVRSFDEDPSFNDLDKFYSGCETSFQLMQKKKFVEARKLLSSACSLLRNIILSGHPETMIHFFAIMYDLMREKYGPLEGVMSLLREYIGKLATIVLPDGHPLRKILFSFATIDRQELYHALLLSIKSLADVSERKGGRWTITSVMNRLVYIRWTYEKDNSGKERILRKLLAEISSAPDADEDAMYRILDSLSGTLAAQGKFEECEEIGKRYSAAVRARGEEHNSRNHLPIALEIMSRSQYKLGKFELAEVNQRACVEVFLANPANRNLTWAISRLGILESWVREWGRIDDADKIKKEIEDLIELDTIGEEEIY